MNTESKENSLPNCMENYLSIKTLDLHAFRVIIKQFNEVGNNDLQVLLHTTYGFIKCDICDIAETDNFITAVENSESISNENLKTYNVDFSYIVRLRNNQLLELEKENPDLKPCDNGSILSLKNVSIYKDNLISPVLNTNQMIVFLDQIIGFSAIPRNH